MHKRQQKQNSTRNQTPDVTWFTPSVGVTSTNCGLFNLLQNPHFDLRTQLQIPSILKSHALSSRPLRTQLQVFPQSFLQNPSVHTAAEVIHAHSWDLTFPYTISLSFGLTFLYIIKPNLFLLQKCLFIHRADTKPWLQTMGSKNPKPWI